MKNCRICGTPIWKSSYTLMVDSYGDKQYLCSEHSLQLMCDSLIGHRIRVDDEDQYNRILAKELKKTMQEESE